MEFKELTQESMKTLVQHPAWKELVRHYILPMFEVWEMRVSNAGDPNHQYNMGRMQEISALLGRTYDVAGYNSPLQRRYDFDPELTTPSEKRKYSKKAKEETPDQYEMPRRSSFAV